MGFLCSMAKRALTYLLLIIGITHAYAMPVYESEWPTTQSFQSQQIMTTGVTYEGIIYTPFDDAIPSDLSEVGASYAPGEKSHGPLRVVQDGRDPGDVTTGSQEYPIGDPWSMLVFAALFAGLTAWRKHHIQIKTETQE